jgi:hypothetical protein
MSEPIHPKNNWQMAEMLRDGQPCLVDSKFVSDVLAALDHHNICAEIEVVGSEILITPKAP